MSLTSKFKKTLISIIVLMIALAAFFIFFSQWLGITKTEFEDYLNNNYTQSEPNLDSQGMNTLSTMGDDELHCPNTEFYPGLLCSDYFYQIDNIHFAINSYPHTGLIKTIVIVEDRDGSGPSEKFIESVRQTAYLVDKSFKDNEQLWQSLMFALTEREFKDTKVPFVIDGISFKYYKDYSSATFVIYKKAPF